ncbi:MAG: maleylpyruvate isomerase family mycothiol-dependent enzyme [Microthrixaceae bacterium]
MDDEILEALDAEQRSLQELVSGLEAEALLLGSRCPGWTIADVLVHLAQTNQFAVASVTGTFSEAVDSGPDLDQVTDVDNWAAAAVEGDRPDSPIDAKSRWSDSADAQLDAFRVVDASARVPWVVGEMAARTLASTRLSETWIHSNDIAAGLGTTLEPTERLWHIARLAHRTIPYAFSVAGHDAPGDVAFVLTAPGGDEWTFGDPDASTIIRGRALELCEVAGQRADAADTGLLGEGPDSTRTLELVRTFA